MYSLRVSAIFLSMLLGVGCMSRLEVGGQVVTSESIGASEKVCGARLVNLDSNQVREFCTVRKLLKKFYGHPKYEGELNIRIVESQEFEGKAINLISSLPREILIARQALYGEVNLKTVLAHELYHALYQRKAEIIEKPDLRLEGEAELASYRVRYPNKSIGDIHAILKGKIEYDLVYLEEVDLSAPWHLYSDTERLVLYGYGAYLVSEVE